MLTKSDANVEAVALAEADSVLGAHLQLVQAPHHVEVLRLAAVAVASSEEAVLAAAVADRVDTRRLEADMRVARALD